MLFRLASPVICLISCSSPLLLRLDNIFTDHQAMIRLLIPLLLVCSPYSSALIPAPSTLRSSQRELTRRITRRNNVELRNDSSEHPYNSSSEMPRGGFSYAPADILSSIKIGYKQRLAADPSFLSKSILEILLAAATQYTAEISRRGYDRILPEIDFVAAGILTAVVGKYFSMWRVAKTVTENVGSMASSDKNRDNKQANWKDSIPTNAFQPTLLDGSTRPMLSSRLLALLLPMPELFRAGVIASIIGYGMTAIMIQVRAILLPDYVMPTVPVSIIGASVYTGAFMAIVSNLRYQLLQGVVEPYLIEEPFRKIKAFGESLKTGHNGLIGLVGSLLVNGCDKVGGFAIAIVRWGNGLLGSWIAIGGMRHFGLQKLK